MALSTDIAPVDRDVPISPRRPFSVTWLEHLAPHHVLGSQFVHGGGHNRRVLVEAGIAQRVTSRREIRTLSWLGPGATAGSAFVSTSAGGGRD